MSKSFLLTVTALLVMISATIQWQKSLDVEHYQLMHEGDKKIMEVLCERIDERDLIIDELEYLIMRQNQYIKDNLTTQ